MITVVVLGFYLISLGAKFQVELSPKCSVLLQNAYMPKIHLAYELVAQAL